MKLYALFSITLLFNLLQFARAGEWNIMVRHSCSGSIEMMPNMPFGFGMEMKPLNDLFQQIGNIVWDRALCQCPTLTERDFLLHFDPIAAVLNALEGQEYTLAPESSCQFPISLTQLSDLIDLNFGDPNVLKTCTVQTWLSTGKCALQYPVSEIGVNINLNLWRCPEVRWGLPGFQITCTGPGCQTLVAPCSNNAQCKGGQTCFKLFPNEQTQLMWLKQIMGDMFGPTAHSCYTAPKQNMVSALMTHARKYFDGKYVHELGFCGIPEMMFGRFASFSGEALSFFGSQTIQQNCLMRGQPTIGVKLNFLSSSNYSVTSLVNPAHIKRPVVNYDEEFPKIFEWTCDGKAIVGDNMWYFGFGKQFVNFVNYGMYLVNLAANCALKTKLTQDQMLTRYGLWSPAYWLYLLESSGEYSGFRLGAKGKDFQTLIFPSGYSMKMDMPKSCTFANWVRTGKCAMQYNGLSSLLQLDLNVVANIEQCRSSSGQKTVNSRVVLGCEGTHCGIMSEGTRFCEYDSDCDGMKCYDIGQMVEGLLQSVMPGQPIDPIGKWLMPQPSTLAGAQQSSPNLCNAFNSSMLSTGADPVCGGNLKFRSEMRTLLQTLGVKPIVDGRQITNSSNWNKVCTVDYDRLTRNPYAVYMWAFGQAKTEARYTTRITLNDLVGWAP